MYSTLPPEPIDDMEPLTPNPNYRPPKSVVTKPASKRQGPSKRALSQKAKAQPRDRIGRFACVGMWLKKARRKVKKARNMLSPTWHIRQHARRRRHFQRAEFERRWTAQYGFPPDRSKRRRRRKLVKR
jgi:hypothetical protein